MILDQWWKNKSNWQLDGRESRSCLLIDCRKRQRDCSKRLCALVPWYACGDVVTTVLHDRQQRKLEQTAVQEEIESLEKKLVDSQLQCVRHGAVHQEMQQLLRETDQRAITSQKQAGYSITVTYLCK